MTDILSTIGRIQTVQDTPTPGNPYIRRCTLLAVDSGSWTATVRLGTLIYAGIAIGHQIKPEALQSNVGCLVAFNSFDSPYDAVLFLTFGGKPPLPLEFDNVRGHAHRKAVPGDGAPIFTGDLVTEQVEQ